MSYTVRSKNCRKCAAGQSKSLHNCRSNYDGSSKSMEPDMALELFTENPLWSMETNGVLGVDWLWMMTPQLLQIYEEFVNIK